MLKKTKLPGHKTPKSLAVVQRAGTAPPASTFAEGLARHQAGHLADAERIYTHILTLQPGHFDSRHLLGVVYLQRGRHAEALSHIGLALKIRPDNAFVLNNHGVVLLELKRFDEALQSLERSIASRPITPMRIPIGPTCSKRYCASTKRWSSYDRALVLRPDFAKHTLIVATHFIS